MSEDDELDRVSDEVVKAAESLERAYQLGALTEEDYQAGRALIDEGVYELAKRRGDLPMTLANLELAILQGADCDELVSIKNRMDKKNDPDYDKRRAGDLLRSVGCYSRSSTRTDQP